MNERQKARGAKYWDQPLEWDPLEREAQNMANDICNGMNVNQYSDENQKRLKKHVLRFSRRMVVMTDHMRQHEMDKETTES